MKTRVAALAVANLLALFWWQGWLSPLLDPPGYSEREPLREARQLRPEAVRATPSRPVPAPRGGTAPATNP